MVAVSHVFCLVIGFKSVVEAYIISDAQSNLVEYAYTGMSSDT